VDHDDHEHRVDVRTIPRIKHAEAMQLTAVENRKFAAALGNLQPGDWAEPTDCARWDVRVLAATWSVRPPVRHHHVSSSARSEQDGPWLPKLAPSTGGTV
jgi:hypothetical protein